MRAKPQGRVIVGWSNIARNSNYFGEESQRLINSDSHSFSRTTVCSVELWDLVSICDDPLLLKGSGECSRHHKERSVLIFAE